MATKAARAVQRAEALQHLEESASALAAAMNLDPPEIPRGHRDPAFLPTLQMEAIASFLEKVKRSVTGEPEPEPEPEGEGEEQPEEEMVEPTLNKGQAKKAAGGR